MSYTFHEPILKFYFLFQNSKLTGILKPPPCDWVTVPWQRIEVKPEERIEKVLAAEDLSDDQILSAFAEGRPRVKKGSSLNVLPAFVLASPIMAAKRLSKHSQRSADLRRAKWLHEHHNPFDIVLGSTEQMVATTLGPPARTMPYFEKRKLFLYGEDLSRTVPAVDPPAWMAVVFENGQTVRVLSNDFVNPQWRNQVP